MKNLHQEKVIIPAIESDPTEVFFVKSGTVTQFERDYDENHRRWDNIISSESFVSCQFTKKGGNVAILSPSVRINNAWQLTSFTAALQAIGHGTYMHKGEKVDYLAASAYTELLDELTRMSIKHDLNIVVLQKKVKGVK